MSAPAPVRPRLLQRPVSAAQRETARRNGRKSRGPVSAQGKAQSSANARTHGLYAKVHILSSDDRARYRDKCDAYLADYSPQTAAETRALAALAFAHTRLQTLAVFETLLWNDALRHAPRGPHRIAHAFESLADSCLFQALGRTESDCLRRAREAARTLFGLARGMGPERTLELADSTVNQPRSRTPPELPVRIEECQRSF